MKTADLGQTMANLHQCLLELVRKNVESNIISSNYMLLGLSKIFGEDPNRLTSCVKLTGSVSLTDELVLTTDLLLLHVTPTLVVMLVLTSLAVLIIFINRNKSKGGENRRSSV